MPSDPRLTHFSGGAPVINVSQPPQQPYQGVAVLGMLTIQACLLMLIAWKMLAPPAVAVSGKDEQLVKLEKKIDAINQQDEVELRMEAQRRVLDQVMTELKGEPRGVATALEEREKANLELRNALRGQDALNRSLEQQKEKIELTAKSKTEKLENELKVARADQKKLQAAADELAKLKEENKKDGKTDDADAANANFWYWVGGAIIAVVALGGLVATFVYKPPEQQEPIDTSRLPPAPVERVQPTRTSEAAPQPEHVPDQP